jgi:preprotein translocase subunit SecG
MSRISFAAQMQKSTGMATQGFEGGTMRDFFDAMGTKLLLTACTIAMLFLYFRGGGDGD